MNIFQISAEVNQFVANNSNGRFINNGGVQCVAVFNQYERDVVKGGWIGTPVTGYASDLWTQYGKDSDYNLWLRVGADQTPQIGDVAIWSAYNGNGLPHVALVLAQNANGSILCFTQNPRPAHQESLVKKGLLGYLRPKKYVSIVVASTPAPAGNGTVHLSASANAWRLYPEGGPYTVGHQKAFLNPSQFGGLSYAILGRPGPNLVTIQTQMYGVGVIYVGPGTPVSFS